MTSRRRCIVAGLTAAALIGPAAVAAQRVATSDRIHLNQIGFYPMGPKMAIVADSDATSFVVLVASNGDTAFRGMLSASRRWSPSNEVVRQADFTGLRRPGRYLLAVPGVGQSHAFAIQAGVMREVARAAAKAFYFQRASTVLPPEYAGRWARPAGHPDTSVIVHASAASASRPAGTRISAPGGW